MLLVLVLSVTLAIFTFGGENTEGLEDEHILESQMQIIFEQMDTVEREIMFARVVKAITNWHSDNLRSGQFLYPVNCYDKNILYCFDDCTVEHYGIDPLAIFCCDLMALRHDLFTFHLVTFTNRGVECIETVLNTRIICVSCGAVHSSVAERGPGCGINNCQ